MRDNGVILGILVVQMILVAVLITVLYYVLRARRFMELDKKFDKYTVLPVFHKEVSLFDRIFNFIERIIKRLSKIFSKSKVLSDYGKLYEKHISYEELEYRSGIDYISIKFLLGVGASLLYFASMFFKYVSLSFIGVIISFIVGFFIIDIFIQIKYNRRRKTISDDLLKAIVIMNNSFQSGMSIMQAIEIVKDEIDGAIGDEFKKIYLDLSYGLTIEVVFNRFYERVQLEDVKFITTSLTLLNKTGGNIVKVFKSIEREFYDKKKLNDELNTVTSSSMFVYRFLLCVPFVVCLLIYILNPSYFSPMFSNTIGILILALVVILYVLYVLVIRKIMRVSQYE